MTTANRTTILPDRYRASPIDLDCNRNSATLAKAIFAGAAWDHAHTTLPEQPLTRHLFFSKNVLHFCRNIFKGGPGGGRRYDKSRIPRGTRAVPGRRGWELHPAVAPQCSARTTAGTADAGPESGAARQR